MLKRSILTALMLTAASVAPALAQDTTADTVVATVNDQSITLGELIVMKQSIQDPGMSGMPDQALWDMMLDQLIRQTAVAETGKENAGARAQIELQRRNALAAAAVTTVAEVEPTEDEVKAAYDRLFAEMGEGTEYSAAHILVKTEEEAKEIKSQLDGGADFGALAEEKSTDNSGPNKGDLGWFSPEQMVQPFGDTVKAMEKGQISDPVETQFGWHVIKLNDSRERQAPALDEVRDQVVQMVRREKVEAEIQRIVGAAKIEKTQGLDPSLLNKLDLLEAE